MQTEILDHLHAVIEMRVDENGLATWRITKNKFGDDRPWQPINHEHLQSASAVPYRHLRNIWMKTYYVILQAGLLSSLIFSRVRDVLAESGGIRLYRNGFRVVPYGDPDNDWLRLDEMYAKRSLLVPVANRNFFGVVEVHDTTGSMFEEHTSREGLIETEAFSALKDLTSSVLVTAVTAIAEDRGRKSRGGRRPKPPASEMNKRDDPLSAAKIALAVAASAAETAAQGGSTEFVEAAKRIVEAQQVVQNKSSELARAEAELVDEANMLRFLATFGMTSAEFNHETAMTFDAFRFDLEKIFEAVSRYSNDDPDLLAQAQRAHGMLERLDTLTSYMNSLASARSARGTVPVSLSRAIEDFERGLRAQAFSQNIQLQIQIPTYDPMFTRPMHRAEIASIFLNLYTNAVKAIKRRSAERTILISASAVSGGKLRIQFCDTGDGIAAGIREKIFDAFFTTNVAPPAGSSDMQHATGTGLGLWIVHQIVDNAGGRIRVSEEAGPFTTCIEIELPAEDENDDAE